MRVAIPPLPQYAFMAWCSVKKESIGTTLPLPLLFYLTLWSRVLHEKLTVTQLFKKFLGLLWNPGVHYSAHNIPPLVPILSQMNRSFQRVCPDPRPCVTFIRRCFFYGWELLATRPTPNLENHPLSAVHHYLFNILAVTHLIWRPCSPSATRGRSMPR
jgi:hypothetical protein